MGLAVAAAGRWRRRERQRQCHAQTALGASRVGGSRHRATAAEDGAGRRCAGLSAGRAGPRRGGRRTLGQFAVPVHPAGRRSDRTAHLVARTAQRTAGRAGSDRCGHRPAARRPGDRPDRRSRRGLAPRADRDPDRQRARRCLCAVPGVDDLQPVQSAAVPRRHGSRAAVLAEPGQPQPTVRQHLGRVGQRHAGHAGGGRHDRAQATAGGTQRDAERCGRRTAPAMPPPIHWPMPVAAIPPPVRR